MKTVTWIIASVCAGGLVWAVTILATSSFTARAEEAPAPDKSQYNLFNPTPNQFLRELNADRPDKTDCPFTVDAGHFQLEMDMANFTYDAPNAAHGKVKTEDIQMAPMNVKVGVLNNVDFQIVLQPWQWQRSQDQSTGTIETKSGFGDFIPRVKVNLIGNDGGFFALALIPFVKLPTAQDHLGNGAVEGGVGMPYAFDVPGWDVGFQSTIHFNHNDAGGGRHTEFDNSVSIGHAVIGKLSYHVEFFSNVSTEGGTGWVGTFDTWLTYPVNPNLILDGGVYIGVTPAADNWHPWLGMTRRF